MTISIATCKANSKNSLAPCNFKWKIHTINNIFSANFHFSLNDIEPSVSARIFRKNRTNSQKDKSLAYYVDFKDVRREKTVLIGFDYPDLRLTSVYKKRSLIKTP